MHNRYFITTNSTMNSCTTTIYSFTTDFNFELNYAWGCSQSPVGIQSSFASLVHTFESFLLP
jgi:hypothetical protein